MHYQLHRAIKSGDLELVNLSIEKIMLDELDKEYDLDRLDEDDQSPVYIAADLGFAEILMCLLENEANPDGYGLYHGYSRQKRHGYIPLCVAAEKGHEDI